MSEQKTIEESINDLKNMLNLARAEPGNIDGKELESLLERAKNVRKAIERTAVGAEAAASLGLSEDVFLNNKLNDNYSDLDQLEKITNIVRMISVDAKELNRYAIEVNTGEVSNQTLLNTSNAVLQLVLSLYSSLLVKLT